jgi:DNA-binding transcriptional MerR regulator
MPESNGLLTVGQAAAAAGTAATTLRFYEREGILTPTAKNRAGYRLYDHAAVERLRFIRSAQAVGFCLDDIRSLLGLDSDNGKACRSVVQPMLERRIAQLDEKMKELKRVREALGRALDRCRRSSGGCAVLDELRPKGNKR